MTPFATWSSTLKLLLGLVVGAVGTPLLFLAGFIFGEPFPFLLPVAVLCVGLGLKVSDEHDRLGDGMLIGYALWFFGFFGLLFTQPLE